MKDDDEEGREAAKWLLIGLAHIGGIGLVVSRGRKQLKIYESCKQIHELALCEKVV